MSTLEDEIRDALRAEAGRLREVRPLRLEPAPSRLGPATTPRRARRHWTWLAPLTAAALVIALAIALVIVRAAQNGTVPPVTPTPSAPTTFPRYYVALEQMYVDNAARLVVGDSVTGKSLATFNAPAGAAFEGPSVAGAADDRTFIVAEVLGPRRPPGTDEGYTAWYLLRLSPGSAHQVAMTRLPIRGEAADRPVMGAAMSGDGRYLAVVLGNGGMTRQGLQIYSVTTGQLLHSWSLVSTNPFNFTPINTLTWVGDATIAFSWIDSGYHWQVRTLAVSAPGTSLQTASHVVWSRYVPPPPHGIVPPNTPQECGFAITADGQSAVECVSSISNGHISPARWLAYSFSAPAKPSVVAVIPRPGTKPGSDEYNGSPVYVSTREVMAYYAVPKTPRDFSGPTVIHEFVASGHTVRQLGTGTIASSWVVW